MRPDTDRFIGESPQFLQTIERVSAAAAIDSPVLLVGERGTGKELMAARLHYLSPRWNEAFLQVNCAAISETLMESELFGHEIGSFTGATRRHLGHFERANNGTLFLDELSTTSVRVQEKLLRLIEYGQFERLGGSTTLSVDVRLIAATNRDLIVMAERGEFRMDLLDRLAFEVITLPPLRERQDDVMLLAEHFAIEMSKKLNREYFAGFSKATETQLREHSWPGNVRELKSAIERSIYRSDPDKEVESIVIDPFMSPWRPAEPLPNNANGAMIESTLPVSLKEEVQQFEIALINRALSSVQYNQRKAAELLGLTYHQFRGYVRKYGITNGRED